MNGFPLSRLPELMAAMAAVATVYCPLAGKFAPWTEGSVPELTGNTKLGPKDLFFTQVEDLVRFRVSGKDLEVLDTQLRQEPFVVFGVRACDCRALEILDRVFLTEPVDTFYQARRANGVVISLACQRPEETCFCGAFGIDGAEPGGDITAWQGEDTLFFRANTEKGQALLDRLPLQEAGEDGAEAAKAKTRAILQRLPLRNLSTQGFGQAENLLDLFNRPEWSELSASCLGCGACTFVCPTCQCYDIKEFDNGHEVCRYRCWDSCMYADFTLMSAGQPRPTQVERFRQRFMHKLQYFPANNGGIFGCVGCGRCLRQCPIHMNIVKVMKTLGGEDHAS